MNTQTDEILSEEEIEARYPDQWVLIDVLDFDEAYRVARGVVRAHGLDEDAVHAATELLPIPRKIAIRWTGPLPKGLHYLL